MLKRYRKDEEITQVTLAQKIGYVVNSNITRTETGQRSVRLWEFIQICEVLGHDPVKVLDDFLRAAPASKIPASVLKIQTTKFKRMQEEDEKARKAQDKKASPKPKKT